MKPSWKDSPSWANYLTQDRDGTYYWWECKPHRMTACWYCIEGKSQVARITLWELQVESRFPNEVEE